MSDKLEYSIQENQGKVEVSLSGYLDATNAGDLLEELKQLSDKEIEEIKFLVSELEYIASAGVRVIIFAKQKIGRDVSVTLVSPQEEVVDVIKMSGLDGFLNIED
ncbi:MAG: STAS domain-containing protein [Bacillota bacterium]